MDNKILIVYYSLTGNTRFIAECLQEKLKADIQQIVPIKDVKPKGGMKYFWGGYKVIMKKKPSLEPIEKDPKDYDVIIIGTPVWVWTIAPPIRTFLTKYDLSNKKVGFWCCHAGSPGSTLRIMEKCAPDSEVLGKIKFIDPLKKNTDEAKTRTIEWANEILIKIGP
jgi:flavodoxin